MKTALNGAQVLILNLNGVQPPRAYPQPEWGKVLVLNLNGVREDSLGWREGAMKGWARNRQRQRGLVGAKGLQPGRTHSELLGSGRGPRKQGWCGG